MRLWSVLLLRNVKKEAADGLVRVIERLNSGSSVSDNTSSGSDNNTSNNSGRKLNIASLVVNINKEDTNVILGRECVTLYGRPYIEDYIGDIKFQISPLSFFQVNPKQTEVLYKKHWNLLILQAMRQCGICIVE